ncbi:MAG TPA: SDR family oxidoreductase [Flavisolibacter sp.]|jgi:short-subunit dehydrogenase|nr:SDR family oxidoreductase [Flavisolibacter sp.]
MTQTNNNGWALVTGASTGIGYELAKLFAQDGYNIIAVARTEEDLQKAAMEFREQYGVQVEVLPKDLFGENAATELYQEVKAKGLEVEVLVNDAGQGVYGLFAETDLEEQIKIIHLNIVSLTKLTYHFLKDMKARNSGKILQLGSVVSELPAPYQAVYGGTKAYVLSFSEALISELKDSAITVSVLQPGATDTDFFEKAGAQDSKLVQDKSKLADPATVAKDGYDALMSGDDKVVSGFKNKAQIAMANVMPDTMLADQMKKQSEPVDKDK